jgi:hypothetical protein
LLLCSCCFVLASWAGALVEPLLCWFGAPGSSLSGKKYRRRPRCTARDEQAVRNWWNERDSNPHLPLARRGLSQLSYHPINFGRPPSPRLRRAAFAIERLARRSPEGAKAGAWGRFRAHLFAFSARRFHQISFPGDRRTEQCRVNWRGRGESNSFRRSGAPALNQSTTSAESSEKNWCAPEDLNLSSADLPVSQTPVLQTGGRRGTHDKWRKVKESNPRP